MFWVESSQISSPLFDRVAGQVKVSAGHENLRGNLSYLASEVLESMLLPALSTLNQKGKETTRSHL